MKRYDNDDRKYAAITVYMLVAFGLTFANIFVTSMPMIGPAMLLFATPMVIVIDVVVDIMFAIKAKKEDKGL